jgi:hypothetical protein
MADPRATRGFASRLLRQDERLSDAQYQEYRTKLEAALTAAELRVKVLGWVVVASGVLMLTAMLLSAGKLLGDFDPWSKEATVESVALGVVFCLATATILHSRFRSGVKNAKERLRDASLLDLQRQVRELRELVERYVRRDEPDSDKPNLG